MVTMRDQRTFSDAIAGAIRGLGRDRVYESEKRNKDGMRWIRHRFPIKGGITSNEVDRREMAGPNPLLARLKARAMGVAKQ